MVTLQISDYDLFMHLIFIRALPIVGDGVKDLLNVHMISCSRVIAEINAHFPFYDNWLSYLVNLWLNEGIVDIWEHDGSIGPMTRE